MNARRSISTLAATLLALLSALAFVLVVSAPAPVEANAPEFEVMAKHERFAGKSYAQWTQEWHEWVLSVPADNHPMLDMDGDDCHRGQRGPVWFLTGLLGAGSVTRHCTVRGGKPVFFPLQNVMYFPWSEDPPLSEQDKLAIEEGFRAAIDGVAATATIDDQRIQGLGRYHFNSGWFDARVPDDNLIDYLWPEYSDWPQGNSGPHYSDGLYLMVFLERGDHEIHFTGWDGGLDVTYELEVE